MRAKLFNVTRKTLLAQKVLYCNRFWSRSVGLLGTPRLGPKEACWLIPCNWIHTLGMKYPIDACFLNKKNEVVAIRKNLKPNRISPLYWKAYSVLEFRAEKKRNCRLGDRLVLKTNET